LFDWIGSGILYRRLVAERANGKLARQIFFMIVNPSGERE
jgi:hypothetical protein